MTKLSYPSDGIYKYTRSHTENVARDLQRAVSSCILNIPNNFTYRKYLLSLRDTLNSYYKEISSIDDKLNKTNTNFENVAINLTKGVTDITIKKITERDRMI